MLGQLKTITYNQTTRSITRDTAQRYQEVRVPFKGTVYRLHNAHRYSAGSAWALERALRRASSQMDGGFRDTLQFDPF